MFRRLAMLLLFFALPQTVRAEDAPLAEYWANSGSLPPEYAWDVTITISAAGNLVLKHCTGYETEGPACKTRKATVSAADLAAIIAAAKAAELAEKPARQTEDIPVGGGSDGGRSGWMARN